MFVQRPSHALAHLCSQLAESWRHATLPTLFRNGALSTVWSIVQAAGWSDLAADLCLGRRARADPRAAVVAAPEAVAPPDLVDRVLTEYRQNGATPELITRTAQHGRSAGYYGAGGWRMSKSAAL
jgi:hypothetical protein